MEYQLYSVRAIYERLSTLYPRKWQEEQKKNIHFVQLVDVGIDCSSITMSWWERTDHFFWGRRVMMKKEQQEKIGIRDYFTLDR